MNNKIVVSFRLVSGEPVTVAATYSSVCVLLWAAMLKPVPFWALPLATGGKPPTAVSSAL